MNWYTYTIPFLPLTGAAINGLIGKRLPRPLVGLIACAAMLAAAIFSTMTLFDLLRLPVEERSLYGELYNWMTSGELSVGFGFLVDQLSVVMMLVVSWVGFLIHVYSVGYMAHDNGFARYFSYLNLFAGLMLILVMAGNFPLAFAGWEGVGLCSYLLIGFWHHKKSAADAGKKAFIVNRIGDFGFLLGLALLFANVGSLDYRQVFAAAMVGEIDPQIALGVSLLLFVGAMGKSAQLPLYVWLPDAMEGPTPVSALIHAATMVTAGVYMVIRCRPLFELDPTALTVVLIVGTATAIFAATIGLAQRDIKRVLAYSTVSQLGYMFMACGLGAYIVALFHLMIHAFFKALLFLGSGSVIHAMHDEQDMFKMGGLKAKLKTTYWTFLWGSLAIAGIFPFAGFFSKDEILFKAFAGHHYIIWGIGAFTALLTSFYVFRVVFMTFHGKHRGPDFGKVHESPALMTVPLVVLAILSLVGGWVGISFLGEHNYFHQFLAPLLAGGHHAAGGEHHLKLEIVLAIFSVTLAFFGIWLARHLVLARRDRLELLTRKFGPAHKTLVGKYYVDEIYDAVLVRPLNRLSKIFWQVIDDGVIDGLVRFQGVWTQMAGRLLALFSSGQVRRYALYFLVGAVAVIGYFIKG